MKNKMTENPDYFKTSEDRKHWCYEHNFLPIYNFNCQPNMQNIVYPDTQFFMTATWNKQARDRIKNGESLTRKSENLVPTAFVYESDTVPIKEQLANIKKDAFKYILSITYSGNKSVHIIVPINLNDGYEIDSSGLYKYLWKHVAEVIFNDTTILDKQCASIGRMSRMPGATRLKSTDDGRSLDTKNREGCKVQTCIFLNDSPSLINLKAWMKDYQLIDLGVSIQNSLRLPVYRPKMTEKTDPLQHLRNSNAKYPTACKSTALMVLDDGNIPSSDWLPENGSYISTVHFLKNKFPELTEEFVTKVKQAHPTCLPCPVKHYL